MSYIIFGDSFTFPEGNAATNRVYAYAKGFSEKGIKVHVICFGNEYDSVADGMIDGFYFYHPFGQRKRSKYFIIRRWQKFLKYYKTFTLIRNINKKDKIIAFICYTHLLLTQLFAFILTGFVKTNMILERSEHPFRNYQGSFLRKIRGGIRINLEIKFSNYFFCISQYLINFYQIRGISPNKILLVPSTVDAERFNISSKSPFNFQYILYCGSLVRSKDGIDILIESFSKISEKFPNINLVLIGKGDTNKEEVILKDLVVRLNIYERVFFLGYLPRKDIPAFINNAKILALARPKSIVADAGFPSKLTEYLSTAIPVVVTEVGDIPFYLKDNENAFLSKPSNVEVFAEKLDFVLSNYAFAKGVALKGKELTDTVFNYKYQAKRIIEFINSI